MFLAIRSWKIDADLTDVKYWIFKSYKWQNAEDGYSAALIELILKVQETMNLLHIENYITYGNELIVNIPWEETPKTLKKLDNIKKTPEFQIKLIKWRDTSSEDSDWSSFKASKNLNTMLSSLKISPEKLLYDSSDNSQLLSQCSEINHSPKGNYQKEHYKFNWPIWFKYFTDIYTSSWCKNYYWANWLNLMKLDAKDKRTSNCLRWIFWGKSPLKTNKVNPEETVISYKDSPLKALQRKLSISGLAESDSKYSSDK